jgi:hypothetical protein
VWSAQRILTAVNFGFLDWGAEEKDKRKEAAAKITNRNIRTEE